jgi:hypothetical protein
MFLYIRSVICIHESSDKLLEHLDYLLSPAADGYVEILNKSKILLRFTRNNGF